MRCILGYCLMSRTTIVLSRSSSCSSTLISMVFSFLLDRGTGAPPPMPIPRHAKTIRRTSPNRLKDFIKQGLNTLEVQVTSTWYNRLVFDAGQPEERRKTWTVAGPDKNSALRDSGLLGPVQLNMRYLVN
jgi:hypothetical protein